MAKKKRKHLIKLNNKVREIFGNLSFDEGVVTLSDDELLELVFLLELKPHNLDRDENIRALRRAWSECDYQLRRDIVSHLSGKKAIKASSNPVQNKVPIDKVDKIIELLDGYGCSPEEEQIILETFIDVSPAKINRGKIENKLNYVRVQKRTRILEEKLQIEFTTENEIEFYHSYSFDFSKYSFSKILLSRSHPIDIGTLLSKTDNEIIEQLSNLKLEVIESRKIAIVKFVNMFADHRYMSEEYAYKLTKAMSVDMDLYHNPIDSSFVESVISDIDGECYLSESIAHFIIEKTMSADLYGIDIPYRVSLSYEKNLMYGFIWRGEDIPLLDDIHNQNTIMTNGFKSTINEIENDLLEASEGLNIDNEIIYKHMIQIIQPILISSRSLKIKEKIRRRVMYHFNEYLKPLREKKMREELLAKTIRDFKNLFPIARSLKRKITLHTGPTNSGKTYSAMQNLKNATTGYYLAPLRLLALEGYEDMKSAEVPCSLITGEEEIIDEDSTHISSTIEMLNFEIDVDVCIIDEIQMINDRDRGWAWANALIGAPAGHLILTGSLDTVQVITEIAEYLGEELEVIYHERKNPLEVMKKPTQIKNIEAQTAIVAFSRKEVLSYKQRLSEIFKVSVVYGNLSPEVRKEEARKFRSGESQVLVATDAIAMGLNLPIRTILFARDNKFDGISRRELTSTEVMQISGRAGRYGMEEHGFVGALDRSVLETIEDRFYSTLPDIELPFSVMASLEHVMLIGEILETDNLLEILTFFADNMEFDGPFRAANIESMLAISSIVGEYDLDLKSRYFLSCAPVSINSPYIESVFHRYLTLLEKDKPVIYIPPRELPPYAHTNDELLNAEDRVKEVSLYLWLSFKFEDKFLDTKKAKESRVRLNSYIETSLQKGDFAKRCKRCKKVLDFTYRYFVCDKCYHQGKQDGYNRSSRKRSRRR